jgi:hypothetical protein
MESAMYVYKNRSTSQILFLGKTKANTHDVEHSQTHRVLGIIRSQEVGKQALKFCISQVASVKVSGELQEDF